ncbi:MAG: DUF4270 family protein [Rikenellaceae bacterium]
MIHSKSKLWHTVSTIVVAIVAAIVGVSCSYDESLGLGLTPSDQEFALFTLENNTSFETSFYMSDSIRTSNVGLVVMGAEKDLTFGERRSGFFTQFVPKYEIDDSDDDWDENYPFGYLPILDSMMLSFSLVEYSGDTTQIQTFAVYEVRNVDFLENSVDSIYFADFDISMLDLTDEPIFTFTYPDQPNGVYVETTTSVRLYPPSPMTADAQYFLNKLMLQDSEWDMDIYDEDEYDLFVDKLNGLYIVPTTENYGEPSSLLDQSGATYSLFVDGSGINFSARSVYTYDPSVVKDTVYMSYAFRYTSKEFYGMSINTVEHTNDLSAEYDLPSSNILIEGMSGVVSKITITQELFEELDKVLSQTYDSAGNLYNTIFMNQARLDLYMPEEATVSYDASTILPLTIKEWFDKYPTRLGMFTNYTDYYLDEDDVEDDESTLEGIEDYDYSYEINYSTILPYNGYLNRSTGSYEMIISGQLQEAWNSFLEAKKAAGGDFDAINWDDVEDRTIIVGPPADNLFTVRYATLQGMNDGTNNAPVRLRLTYTLTK